MRKLKYLLLFVFVIVLLTNCGKVEQEKVSKKKANDKTVEKLKKVDDKGKVKDKKKEDEDKIPVQVLSPTKGDISSYLLFSSNIDTEKSADIYPMTTGIIKRILFDIGDYVKKGTILAELDSREALINEKKSKISLERLEMEFERKKELYKRLLISKETYEKAKFDYEQAKLDWQQKKLLLSYTKIISPISGLVSNRLIKVGNKIATSQLAFSVVYTREKIAIVNIPEQEKNNIFKKQTVIITTKDKSLEGTIKNISPSIDPQNGTFKITVIVKDKYNVLSIGQFVNIKIVKKVHKDVILLSKDALVFEGGKIFVFIVNEKNIANKKVIKTGFDDGLRVEVVKGVSISDKLVTAGKSSLKNKTKVKIIEPVI